MADQVILHRAGRPPERLGLTGALAAGGGSADAVRLDGAPPGALVLEPSPAGAVAEVLVPGVRVAGSLVAPGRRRLVRPGEAIEIRGSSVEVPGVPAEEGTRALAGALLRDAASGGRPAAGRHLLVVEGREAGRRIPLGRSETLGRGREATVRIADPRASRLHVRLTVEDGAVRIEDLGSKNGVRVNAAPLGWGTVAVRPGDEIALGATSLALVERLAGEEGGGMPPWRRPRAWQTPAIAGGLLALCAAALAAAAR